MADTDEKRIDPEALAEKAELEKEVAELGDIPEAEYLDEIYDIIDAVVSRTDDPTIPALTMRTWILGVFFGFLYALVNTLFTFRTNQITVSPFIAVLLSYPLGHGMAYILPKVSVFGLFSLNPGPFSVKEHALIYVFVSACTSPAYALYNIIGQRYQLYEESLSVAACVFFGITTQCFGYGLAGICRRFLVRPAAMLWPSNLSTIALLNSLHKPDVDPSLPMTRLRFFFYVVLAAFVYEWFPLYIAPLLTAVSLLCYGASSSSNPDVLRVLGSAYNGLGFLSFSFDWSLISWWNPITTPLWAVINQFVGLWFFAWVLTPIFWAKSMYGKDYELGALPSEGPNGSGIFPIGHAMNTAALMNRNGSYVKSRWFVDTSSLTLKEDYYQEQQPIYISTWFANIYLTSFITFTACLVHVGLWYGKDVWHRFRTAMSELDKHDIHAKLMDAYPDVPDWWYIILLVATLIMGIAVCQWGGFQLPWWGVLLGFALAAISILPIGTIQAISGQQIGLNVISEFMIGLILPGRIGAVMAFKTFSYMAMYQGLFLVQDLKLGHYMKIPPRAMFTVQLFSTILAVVVNIFTSFIIYEGFGRTTDHVIEGDDTSPLVWKIQTDPPVGWTANGYNVFLNAGAIWGAIGPARFFGPGSPYVNTLYGFLVGAVLPIFPYFMHKWQPHSFWHLVNVPLLTITSLDPGQTMSFLTTPVLVAFGVNYFLKKFHHAWWKKYAYVMSAGLDGGTAIALTVTFLAFSVQADATYFPKWALNRYDVELCAPAYYNDCNDKYKYNPDFNQTLDAQCQYFGTAA
ncbi:hypothetical protein HK405_005327 [Cladochytrium tenue]|nr:hypothetical protein HK405_005327 [Cladochytrium tenue]